MTRTDRTRLSRAWAMAVAAGVAVASVLVAPAPAQARAARAQADLTGDGVPDLVVAARGSVVVMNRSGSVARILTPPKVGTDAGSEYALAVGDFDGDGRADLAVGDDFSGVSGVNNAGAVFVYQGTAAGLPAQPTVTFTQANGGSPDLPQSNDRFGGALVAGDVDGDGDDDLVVGSTDWVGFVQWAGEVFVLKGGFGGLSWSGVQVFSQETPGVYGRAETNDAFGTTLTLDDLTGDGRLDLVVGAFAERSTKGGVEDFYGGVHVLPGSAAGPTATGSTFVSGPATERQFGRVLAAGDVTGDGRADLLAASITPGATWDCGTVSLLKGTTTGVSTTRSRWTADTAGVPGACRTSPTFSLLGASMAVDDIDGDGFADLVAGDPEATVGGSFQAGSVTVLFGRSTGLTTTGAVRITQSTTNVAGAAEGEDRFGAKVAIADLDENARLDLVVGTPDEIVGSVSRGMVHGLKSSTTFTPSASSWARTGTDVSPAAPLVALGRSVL